MLQFIFETYPGCLFIQRLSVRDQEVPKCFSNLVPECLSSPFYPNQTSTENNIFTILVIVVLSCDAKTFPYEKVATFLKRQ